MQEDLRDLAQCIDNGVVRWLRLVRGVEEEGRCTSSPGVLLLSDDGRVQSLVQIDK